MLIGREEELAELRRTLSGGRLVTLVGPGGVGKTTLANALVDEHAEESVFFVSLAPLTDGDLRDAVAGSLGFASFSDLLADASQQNWIIVLDNCEHVIDAAANVAETILADTTRPRIIATSRERLDLDAEHVLILETLSTEGSPSPASELFRTASARRGVAIVDPPAVVDELCRRLDGLPLALELAAARTTSLTAAEILDNLDARLDLLARSRNRGPERHRSLAAAIGWSFHQLDDDTRRLFSALSVHSASFNVEMAASVAEFGVNETRTLLTTLVDRSLVVHEPIAGISWYRMLATIRSFAADQLDDAEREATEGRLLDYMGRRADHLGAQMVMADAHALIEVRRSVRTWFWAIEQGLLRNDRELCHRLIRTLWCIAELGHQAEMADLIQRVLDRWPDDDSPGSAVCWALLGLLIHSELGGEREREVSLRASRQAASGEGLGAALGERTLGHEARVEGQWDDALQHYRRAIDHARSDNEDAAALEIGLHAALTKARAADVDAAIDDLEDVVRRSEPFELVHAWASDFLSYVLLTHDPERSAEISLALLPVAEQTNNEWIAGSSHGNLSFAALLRGDRVGAAHHIAASIVAYRSIRDRRDVTITLLAAAALFVQCGDHEAAQRVMATERSYLDTEVGENESELLTRVGPLPERDPSAEPFDIAEILLRLERIGGEVSPEAPDNRFVLVGDSWEISYGGATIMLRNSKGLTDLSRLISSPEIEIAALDLIDAVVVSGNAGPGVDAKARQEYQDRIRELQREIEAAEAEADRMTADKAEAEMDLLVQELGRAYGLGGRSRVSGDPAEKARSAVTARIRSAIKRISESHPTLAGHLSRSVVTGRFCAYTPAESVTWVTE